MPWILKMNWSKIEIHYTSVYPHTSNDSGVLFVFNQTLGTIQRLRNSSSNNNKNINKQTNKYPYTFTDRKFNIENKILPIRLIAFTVLSFQLLSRICRWMCRCSKHTEQIIHRATHSISPISISIVYVVVFFSLRSYFYIEVSSSFPLLFIGSSPLVLWLESSASQPFLMRLLFSLSLSLSLRLMHFFGFVHFNKRTDSTVNTFSGRIDSLFIACFSLVGFSPT